MLRKGWRAVLLVLFCLVVSVTVPESLAAVSLAAPSITLASGWSLNAQMAYPTGGGAVHDPQGCGWLQYLSPLYTIYGPTSQYHIHDMVIIWYEDSMGASYSGAQLQSEAEAIAPSHVSVYMPEFFSALPTESGVTIYAGVPAGYVKYHNTTVNLYALQLIMVKNGYYLGIYTYYSQGNEATTNSMLNSISVPAPTPTPTPTPTPPTPTPSPTTTITPTPPPTSQTATPTPTPTPVTTPTPTPVATPTQQTATPTLTPTPTQTQTPTPTATSSPSPEPTSSPASTRSPSASPPPSQEASNLTTSVWVPPPQNAAGAAVVSVAAVGVVSLLFAAAGAGVAASGAITTASSGDSSGKFTKKIRDLLPNTLKKWLEALVSSKRKLVVTEKTGSPFVPTKPEGLAYILSTLFLALSFSYVKVTDLSQILVVLPTIFATSILVGFAKTFFSIVYSRRRGVWTEHKIWYFGLATFIVTTFAFRVPFSSPTRNVHYGPKYTKRAGAILSSASVLMSLAFAGFFGILLLGGSTVIGSTGLAMCIIGAFFDTFPIEPMSGKNILNHNKLLWASLFALTMALYASWLFFIQ